MQYRRLGDAGVRVSVLSLGSGWHFGARRPGDDARNYLAAAYAAGVNFFDTAEVYARGRSEAIMGQAISTLGWPRHSYLISTKFYWGIHHNINTRHTLNRKYLLQAIDGSLRRLQHEFVDIVFCHRPDPETPLEETVWAMHDIVTSGRALYWGTSEWNSDAIITACDIADRHHLRRPIVEQPEYNLLERRKVEQEFVPLYDQLGLGVMTWSPLASGVLTGKYLEGVPEGSRASLPREERLQASLRDPDVNRKVRGFIAISRELGCTPAQLAIAWCASNPHVSTVITGAGDVEQVEQNVRALDVLDCLTPEVRRHIDEIFSPDPASSSSLTRRIP